MNARLGEMSTQGLGQPAHTARAAIARILAMLVLLPLLAACLTPGAAEQTVVKAVARAKPISENAAPVPTATPAPTAQPISLGTNGGEWQFDSATLEIAAGEEIALTFHNGAKTTAHNWLLVRGDDDTAIEINKAGETTGEAVGYIPEDARIIARTTTLVKAGQSETVTFTAPAAGTYVYLCTFPGHFDLGMKGVLTVR